MVSGDARMMWRFPLTVGPRAVRLRELSRAAIAAPAQGLSPLPMRYQETHLWVLNQSRRTGRSSASSSTRTISMRVVVTLLRPEAAAYASSDGGASWTRASIPLDVPDADERAQAALARPRLLAEVLFDARDGRRAWHAPAPGLPHRGRRPHWAATPLRASWRWRRRDGLLCAAGEGGLHVSDDGGRNWVHRPVRLPGTGADARLRVRSLVLDQRGGRILLGVRDAVATRTRDHRQGARRHLGRRGRRRSHWSTPPTRPRARSPRRAGAAARDSRRGGAHWRRHPDSRSTARARHPTMRA